MSKNVEEVMKENKALNIRIIEIESTKPDQAEIVRLKSAIEGLERQIKLGNESHKKDVEDGYKKIQTLREEAAKKDKAIKEKDEEIKKLNEEISRLGHVLKVRKSLPVPPNIERKTDPEVKKNPLDAIIAQNQKKTETK